MKGVAIPDFLTSESVKAFCCGWDGKNYTFPLRDHCNNIVGIQRRRPDNSKRSIRGSIAGLFLPQGMEYHSDVVFVCEGLSDTVTAFNLGFFAIGRMSATTGTMELKRLLCNKRVVIVGDNDETGRKAAEHLARKLGNTVTRGAIRYPPEGKDLREFFNKKGIDETRKFLTSAQEYVTMLR
jgi:DNA primase